MFNCDSTFLEFGSCFHAKIFIIFSWTILCAENYKLKEKNSDWKIIASLLLRLLIRTRFSEVFVGKIKTHMENLESC